MEQAQSLRKVSYMATMGVLSAVLLIGQLGMSFLPNIEPITCLIMIYTLVYKKQVFPMIYTFVILEGMVFGFGVWWVSYLYIWTILAGITLLLQKNQSVLLWAVVAGGFGLLFGALCAVPYLLAGGPAAAFSYWAAGIPYDIIHCAGNFVITLAVFQPVLRILKRLHAQQLEGLQTGWRP